MLQQACGAPRRACQSGVTLVETVVALAVAGVLATVGLPDLSSFRDQRAVEGRYQDLNSALRRARSEAVTRGELVSVCALEPGSVEAGSPDCLASGLDWSAGWLVFVDRGPRGQVDDGDKLVAVLQAPAQSGSMVGTQRYLTYRSSGVLLSFAAHFRVLPPGQPAVDEALPGSVLVCVNKPGKARVADQAECSG